MFIRPIATAFLSITPSTQSIQFPTRSDPLILFNASGLHTPLMPHDRDYEHQKAPIFGAVTPVYDVPGTVIPGAMYEVPVTVTPGTMYGVPAPIAGLVG